MFPNGPSNSNLRQQHFLSLCHKTNLLTVFLICVFFSSHQVMLFSKALHAWNKPLLAPRHPKINDISPSPSTRGCLSYHSLSPRFLSCFIALFPFFLSYRSLLFLFPFTAMPHHTSLAKTTESLY